MGQTLQLLGNSNNSDGDGDGDGDDKDKNASTGGPLDGDLEAKRKELQESRKQRGEAIRAEFESMNKADLIQAVRDAQMERVAAYKAYDE